MQKHLSFEGSERLQRDLQYAACCFNWRFGKSTFGAPHPAMQLTSLLSDRKMSSSLGFLDPLANWLGEIDFG